MTEQLIKALRRAIDEEGHLHLDRQQALYLQFFLYELWEHESELRDCASLKYAALDLLGTLPDGREESA